MAGTWVLLVSNVCLLLAFSTIAQSKPFTITNPPRAVGAAACATYNNSIFIMGGWMDRRQFVEYNILSDVMVDHGRDVLPQNVYGHAMYFSQYNSFVYMRAQGSDTIAVYDLSSSNVSTIQKGASNIFGTSACVAASEHFLFIVGGYTVGWLRILNVLSLLDHVWSLGPEMITKRVNQGCVVMPDNYLYAIAGATPQNERISINNLQDQTWHLIDPLTETVGFHGIAPYQGVIWVFGGRDASNLAVYFNKIWNIYTEDGSVALLPESLPFNFSLTSGTMTIVHNIVYLFGEQSMKYVIHPSDDAPSSVPTFVPIATTDIEQEHTQHSALKPPKSSGINSITVIIIIVCVLAFFICMIALIYRVARWIWFENNKKMMVHGHIKSKEIDGDNNQNGVRSKENDSNDQIEADIDGIRDENEDEDWIESLYVKKHNCDETTTGTRSHDHNHTEQQQIIAVEGLPQNGHESNDSQDHVAMGYTNEGPDGIQIMNEKGVMQGAAKVTKDCVSASHDATQ
eukprot:1014727_1